MNVTQLHPAPFLILGRLNVQSRQTCAVRYVPTGLQARASVMSPQVAAIISVSAEIKNLPGHSLSNLSDFKSTPEAHKIGTKMA